jgi:hypothetical protein
MTTRRPVPILLACALVAACGASISPIGSSAPSPALPSSPAAEPSHAARTYDLVVPEGWLAVDVTPDGLHEMAGKLQSTWPSVSQALEAAASGGPSPFQVGQTLLAYDLRPEDLAKYPTGFNVAEVGGQIECLSLDLKSEFENSGIQDVALTKVGVAVGTAVRVSGRITGGPEDVFGATYIIQLDGRNYEPYFETAWALREQFEPTFDGIAKSLKVTEPAPITSDGLPSTFPHDDPALEAHLPQSALGRPLCTWSVSGESALQLFSDERAFLVGLVDDLNINEADLTVGIAGRVNDADPPHIVAAYQLRGATEGEIVNEVAGWVGQVQHVAGKSVYVTQGANSPGHAEGLDYWYPVGDVIYWIKSGDPAWSEDVLAQLP